MIVVYILVAIYGLCVGSFLNVVIYRLPNNMSLSNPPSHCPKCDYKLKWYDNIPVISYMTLGGKCRKCRQPISMRYTLVEIGNMILWLLCALLFWEDSVVYSISAMLLCSLIVVIVCMDLETMYVVDLVVHLMIIPAIAIFVCDISNWTSHLYGALFCGLLFLLIYVAGRLRLKREVMGIIDVEFITICAFVLGFAPSIYALILATLIPGVVFSIIKVAKGNQIMEVPFTPMLAFGTIVALFTSNFVLTWYLGLFLV